MASSTSDMLNRSRLSSFGDDSPKDVISFLPAIHRFCTRGEITLGDYNRNWPIILCCEISRKIGLSLVYKQTVTLTSVGPTPVVTVWFMGISYRYICGYQPINPDQTEEENVRDVLGALYNRMSDVGALPNGIARLCARYELLRPVVLLTLPWFQHLMLKMDEPLYKELMFDNPTRPGNENSIRVKVNSLTQYMQNWSAHYWTSKLFMRCPSYVNMIPLWAAGIPNVRLSNEKFSEIYEVSGFKGGKIQYIEDYLVEATDPQKQRSILHKRLEAAPMATPHPLLLGIAPNLVAYLDRLDNSSPMNLTVDEYIDFFNGPDKTKSKEMPTPTLLIEHNKRNLVESRLFTQQNDDTLFVPIDKPSDFQVTIQEKPAVGFNLLIHNIPDKEKDLRVARQIEITTASDVLALVGMRNEDFEVLDRVRLPAYTTFYTVLSLHVRLMSHVRKPDLKDLNNALKRVPRLKSLAVSWYTEENEKQRKIVERHDKDQEKRAETTGSIRDRKRSHSKSRSRDRSPSRDRHRKHGREKTRFGSSKQSVDTNSATVAASISQESVGGQDLKELCARRLKSFVTQVAETADCRLLVNTIPEGPLWRTSVKFTEIPFMMCGAIGVDRDSSQAENMALINFIGRLVEYGILPNRLVDLVSTLDEWCEPICKVLGSCMNFARAILKSPDYAAVLLEVANLERNGHYFLQPSRVDHVFAVTRFGQAIAEFGAKHWRKTILIAPDNASDIPKATDGSFKIVAADSREAMDERQKERKIKEKQERRAAKEKEKNERAKKDKKKKKRSRSRSRERNQSLSKSPETGKKSSQIDITKPATQIVDLVSDSASDSDREENPEETLRRLAREEAELERKNQEIQRQLELFDQGLLRPEALLSTLNQDMEKEKSYNKLEREMAEKKKRKNDSRSGGPKDRGNRSGKNEDNRDKYGNPARERISPLPSSSNDKYSAKGDKKIEISINLKSDTKGENNKDMGNMDQKNFTRSTQKSRGELLEELKTKAPIIPSSVTTTATAYPNLITTPAPVHQAAVPQQYTFASQHAIPNIDVLPHPIIPSQPPPAIPKGLENAFVPPVIPNIQPLLQGTAIPTAESNEELRKQAELLEEQIRLLQRLEELKKQIGGGMPTAASMASARPNTIGQSTLMQPASTSSWRSNQTFISPEKTYIPPPMDPVRAQRFQMFRKQLPSFIPDWCIDYINEAEKVTPIYLQNICNIIQDQGEIRQLLLEPSFCHEHDPSGFPCAFHRHVGLNHNTVECIVQLPWSRRVRLAELNGICLDKKICIMPHRGECTLRPQQCQFCGDLHFLAWCKKQAQMRNLYDVSEEQVISQNPIAPIEMGKISSTRFTYGM